MFHRGFKPHARDEISESSLDDHLAPVFQRADKAIQRINRYQADKCYLNVLRYTPDRGFSSV